MDKKGKEKDKDKKKDKKKEKLSQSQHVQKADTYNVP
jgi:hypothetical protein